jgi:hypothetical protein
MSIKHWMSWEAGVDLVGLTQPNLMAPNLILHVARLVHTPVGSAPAGMIFWQPDPQQAPAVAGFITTNKSVGQYFGPNIFAGTPFETAPVLEAEIDVANDAASASSRIEVAGFVFECRLTKLGSPLLINKPPAAMTPFVQQGVEVPAASFEVKVNGKPVALTLPDFGMGGGAPALFAPCGIYAR